MLFSDIVQYAREYSNFAYICKFDRDSKTEGEERLYLSNREPLLAENSVREFFNAIGELSSSGISENQEIPFFLGYDSVPEFYPVGKIKQSGWPKAAAMVPDKVLKGRFDRDPDAAVRGRVENSFSDHEMQEKIRELRDRIISGELLQVVLSRRFDLNGLDPFALLQHFMEGDRSLYVFYYKLGEYEIIGSSPENIVSRSGRDLEVHPIAGTIKRGSDDAEDIELGRKLLQDRKELREHRMLVDLARNDLGIVSEPGSVKVVKSMEVQRFASVQHIVSTVHSTLKEGLGNYEIARTLFPAGTVSGAPKVRAIELIDRYEDVARGPYAGGLGVMSQDSMEMALLIRSVFRNGSETYTQAGAGLVMDSDPEKEVREFYSKAATVMGGLRSASIDH